MPKNPIENFDKQAQIAPEIITAYKILNEILTKLPFAIQRELPSIIVCRDPIEFLRAHKQLTREEGGSKADEERSANFAKNKAGSYFKVSNKIILMQVNDQMLAALSSKVELKVYYLFILASIFADVFFPREYLTDTSELVKVLNINQAQIHRILSDLLRSKKLNLAPEDLRFIADGRFVEAYTKEQPSKFVDSFSLPIDSKISSAARDTFMLLVIYVYKNQFTPIDQLTFSDPNLLDRLLTSQLFRDYLKPDEICLPYIILAAKELGGLDVLFDILLNTQIPDSTYVYPNFTEEQLALIRLLARSVQSQEVINLGIEIVRSTRLLDTLVNKGNTPPPDEFIGLMDYIRDLDENSPIFKKATQGLSQAISDFQIGGEQIESPLDEIRTIFAEILETTVSKEELIAFLDAARKLKNRKNDWASGLEL